MNRNENKYKHLTLDERIEILDPLTCRALSSSSPGMPDPANMCPVRQKKAAFLRMISPLLSTTLPSQ